MGVGIIGVASEGRLVMGWAIVIALGLLWGCWLLRYAPATVSSFIQRTGHGRAVVDGDGEFGLYAVCTASHQAQLEKIAHARADRDDDPFDAAVLVPEYGDGEDPAKVMVMIGSIEVACLDRGLAHDFKRALRRVGCADAACLAGIIGSDREGRFGVRLNARTPFVMRPR